MASLRHAGVGRWAGRGHVNRGQVVSAAAFSMSCSQEVKRSIIQQLLILWCFMHFSSKGSTHTLSIHPYMELKLYSQSQIIMIIHTHTCHVYALVKSRLEIRLSGAEEKLYG